MTNEELNSILNLVKVINRSQKPDKKIHDLKCNTDLFDDIWYGRKLFELRKNDRGYSIGDTLLLNDYDPDLEEYMVRTIAAEVSYIIEDRPGLEPGYCVLGLKDIICNSE